MSRHLSRKEAHEAFESRHREQRSGTLSDIQQRVAAIIAQGQTLMEEFATAAHLTPIRVEKIAIGTQREPENERKRALFMHSLAQFEQRLGITESTQP